MNFLIIIGENNFKTLPLNFSLQGSDSYDSIVISVHFSSILSNSFLTSVTHFDYTLKRHSQSEDRSF